MNEKGENAAANSQKPNKEWNESEFLNLRDRSSRVQDSPPSSKSVTSQFRLDRHSRTTGPFNSLLLTVLPEEMLKDRENQDGDELV